MMNLVTMHRPEVRVSSLCPISTIPTWSFVSRIWRYVPTSRRSSSVNSGFCSLPSFQVPVRYNIGIQVDAFVFNAAPDPH